MAAVIAMPTNGRREVLEEFELVDKVLSKPASQNRLRGRQIDRKKSCCVGVVRAPSSA